MGILELLAKGLYLLEILHSPVSTTGYDANMQMESVWEALNGQIHDQLIVVFKETGGALERLEGFAISYLRTLMLFEFYFFPFLAGCV